MGITTSCTIDAPIQRVWDLTLDLEAIPSVTPTITAVDLLDDGPIRVGTRARLRQPGLPQRTWTVEEVEEPSRFVWATTLLGVRMLAIHRMEAVDGDRCELTLEVRFEGRGASLLSTVGRRSIGAALATEAAGFAEAAQHPTDRT